MGVRSWRWRTGIGAAALAALIAVFGCGDPAPDTEPQPGPFRAVTLAGDSVALANLEGRPALVNLWATWCVPCRQEVPILQDLHEAYGPDLRVVGITVDHGGAGEAIRSFVGEMGVTYDIWWDPMGESIDTFGALGVPLTVLLDAEGKVVWKHSGVVEAGDPEMMAAIEELI